MEVSGIRTPDARAGNERMSRLMKIYFTSPGSSTFSSSVRIISGRDLVRLFVLFIYVFFLGGWSLVAFFSDTLATKVIKYNKNNRWNDFI